MRTALDWADILAAGLDGLDRHRANCDCQACINGRLILGHYMNWRQFAGLATDDNVREMTKIQETLQQALETARAQVLADRAFQAENARLQARLLRMENQIDGLLTLLGEDDGKPLWNQKTDPWPFDGYTPEDAFSAGQADERKRILRLLREINVI